MSGRDVGVGSITSALTNRGMIASGSAVRDVMAAADLTIWSYCCSISSESIGLERIGSKLESRVRMPAWGTASFWRATAFSRGASSNQRSRQNAKPTAHRSEEHTSELQ